jgi:hypothetical protein
MWAVEPFPLVPAMWSEREGPLGVSQGAEQAPHPVEVVVPGA